MILHVADLHLGHSTHSWLNEDGRDQATTRAGECWVAAAKRAAHLKADAVLVCGDVFHRRNPSTEAIEWWVRGLDVLRSARVPVAVIPGNHDAAPNPAVPSALELVRYSERCAGCYPEVLVAPGVASVGDLKVAALPWANERLLGASRLEARTRFLDAMRFALDDLRSEKPDVLMAHFSVDGATYSNERSLIIGADPVFSPEDLEGPWRYVALGHIHKAQSVGDRQRRIGEYSGSIDRVSFSEQDEEKVALEVHLGNPYSAGRYLLPARKMVTINAERPDLPRPDVAGAVVRLKGRVHEDDRTFDPVKAREGLLSAGAEIVKLDLQYIRRTPPPDHGLTRDQGPREALARWLASHGDGRFKDEQRAGLVEAADELIEHLEGE